MGPHGGQEIGICIVIGRYDNDSNRRQALTTIRSERSVTYVPSIQKLKRDDKI